MTKLLAFAQILLFLLILLTDQANGRATDDCRERLLPRLSFSETSIFPKDRSLKRPEDGKQLADGRIIVADNEHGLRIFNKNGTWSPFGKFKEAGFRHDPPEITSAPNGVWVSDDGSFALVSDVYKGKIYRIDLESEDTEVIVDHEFGVNTAVADSRGNVWFSQSTDNAEPDGSVTLYGAINKALQTGAVYFVKKSRDGGFSPPVKVADGLYFANGIAFSNDGRHLYVAETMMDRVLVFKADTESGRLSGKTTLLSILTPDNLTIDGAGRLWIASPISNSIFAYDPACANLQRVFHAYSESNSKGSGEWVRRSHLGMPLLELFTPAMWEPLPGAITGMFFSTDKETLFITGLGDALLKYELR